ncbi:MAG TPA: TIGR01777 family oxidoreductase [Candidatus Limnocylindrales bacterium]|nr:TIGR01777 family oxidoreductase [Candidatus Limnocylindrales bacterium]
MNAPIVITGANGLVGSALAEFARDGGFAVRSLVRRPDGSPGQYAWDPATRSVDPSALDGVQAVVHLAGENIADRRWTDETKSRILSSRTQGTQFLCETLARLRKPPQVLVSASAVGFYGDRGSEPLDETSSRGRGFLAEVCEQWEQSTSVARDAGIRVVLLRLGVVMTPAGGALAKMLTPFRFGGGATLGSGEQYVSWIALEDLLAAIVHCIGESRLDGPVNATAPAPVTNAELTRTLASVLRRPAFLRVPAFVLRGLLGEMADEMLLASAKVLPRRLDKSGFVFRYPELGAALSAMLAG